MGEMNNGYTVTKKGYFIIYDDLDSECGFPKYIINLNQVTTIERNANWEDDEHTLVVNGKHWYTDNSLIIDDMLSCIEKYMMGD